MSDQAKPSIAATELDSNHDADAMGRLERLVMPEFSFWHDWGSFSFGPMNWRDFTVIHLGGEVGPNRYYEIHAALLGFHFWSQWLKE